MDQKAYAGWLPQRLNNFGGSINILQAMLNTYSYVIPKVICTVVSACIAAYGFGRFDFPGRKLLFNIMLATLFLPQVVLNVPQYLLYNKFGWVDSPLLSGHLGALRICYRDLLRVSAGAVHAQRPA